jgi:hypothetical protein
MRLAWLPCSLLLFTALSVARPAHAAAPVSKEAQEHFNAGVSFLQDPDGARYEEAYREFKAAYAASPSWKILGNLGIAALKLERDGEAIAAFRQYLADGGSDIEAEERTQVQRDLSTLEASAAKLKLELPEGAMLLDERFPAMGSAIQNSYGPAKGALDIGVRPGRHRFTASLDGKTSDAWDVELQPQESKTHAFSFDAKGGAGSATASTGDGNGLRIASYVAFGVGAVGLGVGTVFGLRAQDRFKQGNALCPTSGVCTLSSADAKKRKDFGTSGDTARTISVAGFVAGGVGVVGGVVLFVLSGSKKRETAAIEPYVSPTELGIVGSF